jgi:hypothetical protein
LAALLITSQVIGQFQESLVPFLFFKRRKSQVNKIIKKQESLQKVEYFNTEIAEDVQKQAQVEGEMEEYLVCNFMRTIPCKESLTNTV